jgi:hypothetical protein
MKGIGRLVQIGLGKESTRGVANTTAGFWNPWMDLTLDEKKEFATDNQAYGIIEDNVNLTQTKKWVAGTLNGIVTDISFPPILYAMFGAYAKTGSGPYVHTFTVGESAQHQSYSFLLHDPLAGQDYSYANGVIEKLEITFALKKFIEFNATIQAQSGVPQSAFTPSTTAENRFLPQYLAASFAPTYTGLTGALTATGTAASTVHVTGCSINPLTQLRVGMGVSGTNIPTGATVAKLVSSTAYDLSVATTGAIGTQTFTPAVVALKSAKVTINGNVESQDVLGSLSPADFLNKEFSIEVTFECIWQNETDAKTYFMDPQPQAMSLIATNTDVAISGGNPIFNITLAKCTFEELGRPFKVKDLVYQSIKAKCSYSLTDSLLGEIIMTNSNSSGY